MSERPLDLDIEPQTLTASEQAIDEARASELRWVLTAHDNRNAVVTPRADRVIYRSTRAGDMAVYLGEIDRPEIAPRRLWLCPTGCQLLGTSRDGLWAALRLGPPTDSAGRVVGLRIDGGPPAVDESPEWVSQLAAASGEVRGAQRAGPCGTERLDVPMSLRAALGPVGVLQGTSGALTWESPLTPADLWRYSTASRVFRPLRHEARPGLAALGDARLVVDRAAAVMALVPQSPARTVVVVEGVAPNPAAAWDPVARALAGYGHAVVRSCRRDLAAQAGLLQWLGRQAFAAGRPLVFVNAGPGVGLAVSRLSAAATRQAAVEAPWWWWGAPELAQREPLTGTAPVSLRRPATLELPAIPERVEATVLFDGGLLDEPGRRLVARLRRAGAQVIYAAEPQAGADEARPKLWRRALRLAALLRFLDGLSEPPALLGGID